MRAWNRGRGPALTDGRKIQKAITALSESREYVQLQPRYMRDSAGLLAEQNDTDHFCLEEIGSVQPGKA